MKILLLFSLFISFQMFGQSVELKPGSNGFVLITNVSTLGACGVADKGKIVYYGTDNSLRMCNGSSWVNISAGVSFSLPYAGTATNAVVELLKITNTSTTEGTAIASTINSTTDGSAIIGIANNTSPSATLVAGVSGMNFSNNAQGVGVRGYHAGSGYAFYGNTGNGIAAYLSSTNGYSIQSQGKIRIAGNGVGTLGANKFLKSMNVSGDAEWSDLTPYSDSKNSTNNLIYLENTNTSTNLSTILSTSYSGTLASGVSGIAANTAPTNNNAGIRGVNKSTSALGYGVYGVHEGNGIGVNGESNGIAIKGKSTNNLGGYFTSDTEDGLRAEAKILTPTYGKNGVEDINNATNDLGSGVYGYHSSGGSGVYGKSNFGGDGVLGEGYYGVHGKSYTRAVYGEGLGSQAGNQFSYGVYGTSTYGYGVFGSGTAAGIKAQSATGYGLVGYALNTNPGSKVSGVYGESKSTTAEGYGVYGVHEGYGSGIRGFSINGTGGTFNSDNGYALTTQYGNVGIGTSTPAAKMDIKGSENFTHFYYSSNEDTYIRGGKAGSKVLINDVAGSGSVGIGHSSPNELLDVNGRMRIRHNVNTSGLWMSNSTNSLSGADGAFYGMKNDTEAGIFIGGTWRFWVNNAGNGYLNGNLIQTSDRRLKKDFLPLTNSLSSIYNLNGYHFKWKEEARSKDLQTGLIAQEVQKIFPELVQTDKKGFLSVNYIGLVPHLIEAVKELIKENDALKNKNQSLESRLDKIEAMLTNASLSNENSNSKK